MEENKHCTDSAPSCPKRACGALPFVVGVLVALAFGWWVFPGLMFKDQPQPFFFSHKVHVETVQISCTDCHSLREDGSFTGVPTLASCMGCHTEVLTSEPGPSSTKEEKAAYEAEKIFVDEYVATGKEVPWQIHQKQPDNVFFSHAAHFNKCFTCHLTMKGALNLGTSNDPERLCMTCHISLDELDKNIPVQENVLTGYGRTTMKMWECEKCHAHPGHFSNDGKGRTAANNACYTCHK